MPLYRVQLADDSWRLVHVEFQTGPDTRMPMRMLAYACQIESTAGQDPTLQTAWPIQLVLYIGPGLAAMPAAAPYPQVACYSCPVLSCGSIPAEAFLALPDPAHHLLALLGHTPDIPALLRQLVAEIVALPDELKQREHLERLFILAGLRKIESKDIQSAVAMDVRLKTILKESPWRQSILKEGVEKGMEKGRLQERLESAARVVAAGRFTLAEAAAFWKLPEKELAAAVARIEHKE